MPCWVISPKPSMPQRSWLRSGRTDGIPSDPFGWRATMRIIIAVHVGLCMNREGMVDTVTVSSAMFDPNIANNTATVVVT